jgi:2-oxo-3-hexenedioate decarboxylase
MKQELLKFSETLDTAAKDASPLQQLSNLTKLSLSDAYDIQKESINRRLERGEILTGIKLGFTSKAKMEQMGVHDLIWGRLTDKMSISNNGTLELSSFIHPRAEPEIAYLLKQDITELINSKNVSQYVSSVCAAIEIIDSRYENFKFSLEDVIADNCSSSAYVLGDWKDFSTDASNLEMTLKVNNKVVHSGNSSAILGNPLNSLLEAFRLANQYKVQLKKDMVILAGAATPAVFIKKNDAVEVEVNNLGKVSLNVN